MNRVFCHLCGSAAVALLITFLVNANLAAQQRSDQTVAHESGADAQHVVSETNQGPVPSEFQKPKLALIGSAPEGLVVADLNNDGHLDLVSALQNAGGSTGLVSVAMGAGGTVFSSPVYYSSGGKWASSVAVADVNNDGRPDIVVTNYDCTPCASTTVGVLLGNGDGTFQAAVTYNLNSSNARGVAVGDLNNDGNPDLMVAAATGVIVLLGNGDGTFQSAVSHPVATGFQWIATGDLNDDHNLDVVACTGTRVMVMLGNGDGSFQTPAFYASGAKSGSSVPEIAIGDLNGDGSPDIVAANYPDGTVGVLLNQGSGTFAPAILYNTGATNAWSLAIGDVTGDLKPDLAVVNLSSSVSVLPGNGDGTFQSALMYSTIGSTANDAIVIADINKDRKPDLVVSDGQAWADIFLNQATTVKTTTTTLVSSPNPATLGQAVTFTATVSSSEGPPPNGELVTFKAGATVLGAVPLQAGTASLVVDSLSKGNHSITAKYPGDSDFLKPSTSPVITQVINP